MPYLPGGDLLGLVNDELAWNNLGQFSFILLAGFSNSMTFVSCS